MPKSETFKWPQYSYVLVHWYGTRVSRSRKWVFFARICNAKWSYVRSQPRLLMNAEHRSRKLWPVLEIDSLFRPCWEDGGNTRAPIQIFFFMPWSYLRHFFWWKYKKIEDHWIQSNLQGSCYFQSSNIIVECLWGEKWKHDFKTCISLNYLWFSEDDIYIENIAISIK